MNQLLINGLNLVAEEVHENSKAHGFHNFEEDSGQFLTRALLLINCEVAEAFEAYRKHELNSPCDKAEKMEQPLTCLEEELADIIIRAMDIGQRLGVDVGRAVAVKHAYNVTRPYRHGNKAA